MTAFDRSAHGEPVLFCEGDRARAFDDFWREAHKARFVYPLPERIRRAVIIITADGAYIDEAARLYDLPEAVIPHLEKRYPASIRPEPESD